MKRLTTFLIALVVTLPASAADGLTVLKSRFDVAQTEQRLRAALNDGGMKVLTTVDHAAAARKAALALPPTRLVIFGNPKVGTRLMQCGRTAGIDLPMKMLIWEENGVVRVGYNTPRYLGQRHRLTGCDAVLAKVANALNRFAGQAAGR